jgi:hypothetical protein
MIPDLRTLVRAMQTDDLPALIGELEAARAAAWARLVIPAPPASASQPAEPNDEMLTPQAAAAVAGVTVRWLYRHTRGLRFRRDLSRKVVRFERSGLVRWIAARRP